LKIAYIYYSHTSIYYLLTVKNVKYQPQTTKFSRIHLTNDVTLQVCKSFLNILNNILKQIVEAGWVAFVTIPAIII